jgi:hypothetical protein
MTYCSFKLFPRKENQPVYPGLIPSTVISEFVPPSFFFPDRASIDIITITTANNNAVTTDKPITSFRYKVRFLVDSLFVGSAVLGTLALGDFVSGGALWVGTGI